jgi:hypothetical protein
MAQYNDKSHRTELNAYYNTWLLSLLRAMQRVLIPAFVTLCMFGSVCAATVYDRKSTVAVGDTIPVLPQDTSDLHLLVFLPEMFCSVFAEAVSPIRNRLQLASKRSVDVTVFISTDDDVFARQQKVIHSWDFRVYSDPIRAYQRIYRVQVTPTAVLANRCGIVLAVGRLGSTVYDWDTVVVTPELLDQGCFKRLNLSRLRKEVALKGSEALSGAGRQRQVNIIRDSLIVVNASPLHLGMVFSLGGDSLLTFSHKAGAGYLPYFPIMVPQPYDGRTCLFIDFTLEKATPIMSVIDFEGNVLERKQWRADSVEVGFMSIYFSTDARLETVVSGYRYNRESDRGTDRTGCIAWDRASGNILYRFVRDSIHDQADLSNYDWTISWIDDEEIAYISNLGQTLYVHRRTDGQLMKELRFNPDTSAYRTAWLAQGLLLNESSTIEERQLLQTSVSATSILLKDSESGDYYIGFYNFSINGSIDGYVSGPVGSLDAGTWYLGRSHRYHKISNGVLYATALQDGIIVLRMYDLLR